MEEAHPQRREWCALPVLQEKPAPRMQAPTQLPPQQPGLVQMPGPLSSAPGIIPLHGLPAAVAAAWIDADEPTNVSV